MESKAESALLRNRLSQCQEQYNDVLRWTRREKDEIKEDGYTRLKEQQEITVKVVLKVEESKRIIADILESKTDGSWDEKNLDERIEKYMKQ